MKPMGALALQSLFAIILVLAVACGQAATPTAAPVPTHTPAPIAAPTATTTPTPTATATPAPSPTPTPSAFPLSIIDGNGNEVTLEKPPDRIVAIDGAAVEILFAMGEGHRVVGTHTFVFYPPETEGIEKIGSAFAMDFEAIAALEPDLTCIFFDRFLPELQNLGIQVLYLKPVGTLEEVAERMRTWGKIVHNPGAAEELARQFEASIKTVRQKLAVKQGPRVFHDAAPGLWTSGSGSLANEIYTLLKAQNVFGDMSGSKQVSPEEIVARDPQVIISVHPEGPELIRADPAFQELSAVQAGRLFVVEEALLSSASPRLVQGIEQVAKLLYPDLFP